MTINDIISIITAITATIISLVAFYLSVISFKMQKQQFICDDMPDIEIDSIGVDLSKLKIITNVSEWKIDNNVIDLSANYKKMLSTSKNQVSTQIIENKEYMLVNLLSKNSITKDINWKNVILILDVWKFQFSIPKGYANTLLIEKAYSAIPGGNLYAKADHNFITSSKMKKETEKKYFELNMAYACEYNQGSSINLELIKKLYRDQKKMYIDFLNESSGEFKAKDFITFSESSYLYKVQSKSGKYYYYTLQMIIDNLFKANMWNGKKSYSKLFKNIRKHYSKERIH